jgi:predicted site-specific integrase-resolvase
MKLRLDAWLKKEFDPPPAITTARGWIREGKIFPAPIKLGRSYYVEETAVFQDRQTRPSLASRIPR